MVDHASPGQSLPASYDGKDRPCMLAVDGAGVARMPSRARAGWSRSSLPAAQPPSTRMLTGHAWRSGRGDDYRPRGGRLPTPSSLVASHWRGCRCLKCCSDVRMTPRGAARIASFKRCPQQCSPPHSALCASPPQVGFFGDGSKSSTLRSLYCSLTLFHYKKKEVARSRVRGVEIEFNIMKLASILGIPGNNGICEYIKDNVVPRFGKRDTTSYMDLIYMDHLISRRLVNLPRVMMRHMSYVISVKDHELPYSDWLTMVFEAFDVPLIDKQGEEPKRYDYFEETFLTICQLKRENVVWWLGIGDHRRRDDDEEEVNNDDQAVNEEEQNPEFDWEAVVDEAALQGESGSDDQLYDAQVEVEEPVAEAPAVPVFPASPGDSTNVQKEPATTGVDPSIPSATIPDS
ncbi:hypothetical protein Dimus_028593 [Dionaea muscipula]